MTFESALPYVSIGCFIGAGAAAAVGPSPGVQRTLKAVALLSLAVFAFLRGTAPAALAMALVLSGLGWAAMRERGGRITLSQGLFALAWLVLAWLFMREGLGPQVLESPIRLGGAVLAIAAAAGLAVWAGRGAENGRPAAILAMAAPGLLVLASLTLRDSQWPAMVGAAALFLGQAAGLAFALRPQRRLQRLGEILPWVLSYAGQAAMAYVFLR